MGVHHSHWDSGSDVNSAHSSIHGRYDPAIARLSKDVVLPYNHIAPLYTEPEEEVAAGEAGSWHAGRDGTGGMGGDDKAGSSAFGTSAGADPWARRHRLLFFQGTINRKNVRLDAQRSAISWRIVFVINFCGLER